MTRPEYRLSTELDYERGRWLAQVVDGAAVVRYERPFYRRESADRARAAVLREYELQRRQLVLPGLEA